MDDRVRAMDSLRENLRRLLVGNTKDGYSRLLNRHYCYVAPSLGTYPDGDGLLTIISPFESGMVHWQS